MDISKKISIDFDNLENEDETLDSDYSEETPLITPEMAMMLKAWYLEKYHTFH